MRAINWLHISDLHIRKRDAWSQDVVLKAMCDSIAGLRSEKGAPDFILVTGDLAFAGKTEEYELVKDFLNAVSVAAGVPKARVFCIPGNHDIDRERQRLCFAGARTVLASENQVDPVLAPDDNLATLLQRQEEYREFQRTYFENQQRTATSDGLAYVSLVTIEDIRLAIVGLDSAWLAEGGAEDHGELLIGERQVRNALDLAVQNDPHLVIAMSHHPLHLLREFDRYAVMNRIDDQCKFFHCGHLHQPEARGTGFSAASCLTVTAGASFETRESRNTYTFVTLSVERAIRTLKTVQYEPARSAFVFSSSDEFPIALMPAAKCAVSELADALAAYDAEVASYAYYLAALLLEKKAELPIRWQNGYVFYSFGVLQDQPDSELRRKTEIFMTFKNVLSVLYGRIPLEDLLAREGGPVAAYARELAERCRTDPALAGRLAAQDRDVRDLEAARPRSSYTAELFADLVDAEDWGLLREQAQRHCGSPDAATAVLARRMLALAHSNGGDDAERAAAIDMYRSLAKDGSAESRDLGNFAKLLHETGQHDEAKSVLIEAIRESPQVRLDYFREIGQRFVEATGDRNFRKELEAAIVERGARD